MRERKILIGVQPFGSHVRAVSPLARALTEAGHMVRVATPDTMRHVVRSYRMRHASVGVDWTKDRQADEQISDALVRDGNDAFCRAVLARFTATAIGTALDVMEIAEYWRPDVIISDPADLGSALAAERLEIRHVTADNGLAGMIERYWTETITPALIETRRALDLADERGTPFDRVITPAPPHWLLPEWRQECGELIAYQHTDPVRVGERLPRWLAKIDPAKRVVYVSLGSILHCVAGLRPVTERLFGQIVEALARLDCVAIVAAGDATDALLARPRPEHVHVTRIAPQTHVLRVADLFVTHGGFASLREAVGAAVPLVLMPISTDGPDNAARCAALGTGRVIDPWHTSADEIASALDDVLTAPGYRQGMRTLQRHALALPPFSPDMVLDRPL